ncbi:hypothetical protein BH11PSE12_BH11PSE12_29560 [soil metagenome]
MGVLQPIASKAHSSEFNPIVVGGWFFWVFKGNSQLSPQIAFCF